MKLNSLFDLVYSTALFYKHLIMLTKDESQAWQQMLHHRSSANVEY
jgi:hypothetical protein